MAFFKINSWKDLLLHLLIVGGLITVLVTAFFYIYLPASTNHGETITVPNVEGLLSADLDEFLNERDLRYEVTADSGFSADLPPLSVLKQFPAANDKVKENRKIYVTLNAENAPLVRMPKLVKGSVKNAHLVLKTYDLRLGEIEYVADLALNYILEQKMDGRNIEEGTKIPKGSVIDIVVGDGLGQQSLSSPNLLGLDLESAQFAILGSGLKIGKMTYEKEGKAAIEEELEEGTIEIVYEAVSPGAIYQQYPTQGTSMRLGQRVDLWIFSPDSLNNNPTLLDR
ncbi:MAG: beta-lactam-binding protein with PASTA domain [Marinoscillum sp.]|jgi:beta-lactam-binding protein with PASTA domain